MPAASSRMTPPQATVSEAPDLRADARLNRGRILEAARTLFATRGLNVPMAAVARHAGVGVATLYRRFPTRESLITTVFADQFAVCAGTIDDALAGPDPWEGFCSVIEKVCAMNVIDRGFTAAFLTEFPDATEFEAARIRAEEGFAVLTQRAKDAGRLRSDFDRMDLSLAFMANSGITAASTDAALAASRRLVAFLLHSFRADLADPTRPLPPPAPLSLYHLPWPTDDLTAAPAPRRDSRT
ncbi:TetR/AcrR family transcriptional regulator [Streptomyces sp. NPDC001480]|uniref:TetR/AcrR family transcriptional regulator n=1 Tax=Streptomyces sp. NPDC001480 TaxID=3364577 RepID=UPI0036C40E3F